MYKALIIAGLLMLWACTEVVEYTVPQAPAVLGFNTHLNPDSAVKVYVFRSAALTDTVRRVSGMRVELWEDEQYRGTLPEVSNGCYQANWKPSEGSLYRIEVSGTEAPTLRSHQRVPKRVAAGEARFVPNSGYDTEERQWLHSFEFVIHDPAEEENYYEVLYYGQAYDPSVDKWSELWLLDFFYRYQCNDPLWKAEGLSDYRSGSYFFSDKQFNGTDYTFRFESRGEKYEYNPNIIRPPKEWWRGFVAVRSVSYDYYMARRRWLLHLNNRGYNHIYDASELMSYSFMGQAVPMHSNVQGGVGVMGAYSTNFCPVDFSAIPW